MKKIILVSMLFITSMLFASNTNEEFGGFGITILSVTEGVQIMNVIDNSPALNANLQTGDLITSVDGQSLANYSIDQSKSLLRGKSGSTANITIKRDQSSFNVSITRANFIIKGYNSLDVMKYYNLETNQNNMLSPSKIRAIGDAQVNANMNAEDLLLNGRSIKNKDELSLNSRGMSRFSAIYIENAKNKDDLATNDSPIDANNDGFTLKTSGYTTVNLINAKGKVVKHIDMGNTKAGIHHREWTTEDLNKGYYLIKVNTGSNSYTGEYYKK